MTDTTRRHPITLKRMTRAVEGMELVAVSRDIPYSQSGTDGLTLDVYHPAAARPAPAVIVAAGYPDVGVPLTLGCQFKEMAFVVSLAQLIAMRGLAAIAYTTSAPAADAERVLDYVLANGSAHGIDPGRVAVWAASGNGPVAVNLLMARGRELRAGVLSTAFTLDIDGNSVADAARNYRFVNAAAGRGVHELPADLPLFIGRAGADEFAGLNTAMDRFIAELLVHNRPVTIYNYASGQHAFEVTDESRTSHYIVDAMLSFVEFHLNA
jgi:hypothetical protein